MRIESTQVLTNSLYPVRKENNQPTFRGSAKLAIDDGIKIISSSQKKVNLSSVISKLVNKFHLNKEVPMVSGALLAFFTGLQTKKEFLDEYAEKVAKGEYISPAAENSYKTLKQVTDSGVLKSYDFPSYQAMFNEGHLTNSAYNVLKDKVTNSSLLSSASKREILNKMARDNGHLEDVSYSLSFNGTSSLEKTSDIHIDDDTKSDVFESVVTKVFDFFDDLL